jgi:hypothetical protein
VILIVRLKNQAMKKCAYCGRESADEAGYCRECGTEFVAPPDPKEPIQPRDPFWAEWLGVALRAVGIGLAVGLLYLLSFGPVERYCGRTISPNPAPTTFTVNGQTAVRTTVRTVRYPPWVGVVYRPAFMLRGNHLYGGYLQWWEERPR